MIVKMGYMLQKEERRMGGGNVSQDQTSIICIDLKSFYASVECVERGLNPFKTNLVVADPTRSKSTICLAITPAMKALGIKNRCRIHEIPDCVKYITAMPRMQLYMDYSAKIYGIYLRYAAFLKDVKEESRELAPKAEALLGKLKEYSPELAEEIQPMVKIQFSQDPEFKEGSMIALAEADERFRATDERQVDFNDDHPGEDATMREALTLMKAGIVLAASPL